MLRLKRLLPLLLASSAMAQTSLVRAALDGTVSDSAGGRIAGASVRVKEVGTQLARDGSTNAEGVFRFSELPLGTYEVVVSQTGFAPYQHAGVALQLGATVHLDVVLPSGAVTTRITVTAQPPPLDPSQTSLTTAVDKERIEELPVESRNYLNFALLAPGVASSAQQAGRRSIAPLPDSGFTFGGLRGRSNNIAIDGLDNNDEYAGSSRTELSLETVQEFQVVNAGLSAETGGASGGSINVVTRIGSNAFHGDAFLFVENGALDARNPFEAENQPPGRHRGRGGMALGGPLIRNRTFYYFGFEQEHGRSLEDADIPPAVASAINRILGARRVSDDSFPASRAETEASAKINHQLTPRNSLMVRYAFTNNREAGDAFHTSGWDDPSSRGSSFTQDNAVAGSLTPVFSPASLGDLRFQIADRRVVLRTNDAAGPGVQIAGLVNFGRPYDGNGTRTETHDQVTYTYSHALGHHLFKAGATLNRVHLDAAMADGFGGLYLYGSLADFAAHRPDSFRQVSGVIATSFAVQNFGAFAQDHWSLARGLTLDLGVRYDVERLPAPFHQDGNNVSPRAGLAWQAAPTWVIRAGYGIFFDRYVLAALNRVLHPLETVFTGDIAQPTWRRADSQMATPYSQQASFAVEHQLSRDLTATVSYLFVRGVKLPRTRAIASDIFQLEDSAASTYHGAGFTLNRRMSNELEFSASYMLSKTFDDASDYDEQPEDALDLRAERAVSRQHQQQRLVFNALWELPIGDEEPGKPKPDDLFSRIFGHIEAAPIFTVESGRPVDPLTGIDTFHTLGYPLSARPAGLGRNSFRTPPLANIDFRLLKFFPIGKTSRLDIVAEAFNLFNHANVSQVNPIYGPGPVPLTGFLQPLAGAGSRRIQFSLDFEF
jgi:hypothetical protein